MTRYGCCLSAEEHEPAELVRQARLPEEAGFDGLWISDRFHPWLDEQGQSGFVWSMIGAISMPESPPPAYMSGFGDTAIRLADGSIGVQPSPEFVRLFRESGGGDKPAQGSLKVCWGADAGQERKTMHRLWPTEGIPGEASQLLPLPRHFSQLSALVTGDMIDSPCGPDPADHVTAVRAHRDAGFDEVCIAQVGGNCAGFFEFFADQVLPRLRGE